MPAIRSRFPPTLPICRWCGQPGLHGTTAECLVALRAVIDRLKTTPMVAQPIRKSRPSSTRTRSAYYLRRDRCDLPKTTITTPETKKTVLRDLDRVTRTHD